jgi:hypothetical protein
MHIWAFWVSPFGSLGGPVRYVSVKGQHQPSTRRTLFWSVLYSADWMKAVDVIKWRSVHEGNDSVGLLGKTAAGI